MIWMFLALSRAKGGCCLLQQDVDLGLVLEWLMSIFSTDCTIFGWYVPTVILFYILCKSKTCGTVAGTLISRYNGGDRCEKWRGKSRDMELHCIWHSFHHDLLKVCERFSLCMQKKCKVGKPEQKRWWSDLWTLESNTFYTGLHSKFWNQDLPILHWASNWALLYLDALFVRDNVPFILFPSIPMYLAPHPTLSLYVGQTRVTHSGFTPILLLPLNTPKKSKVKGYRWWAICWKLQVQMEGASPSY